MDSSDSRPISRGMTWSNTLDSRRPQALNRRDPEETTAAWSLEVVPIDDILIHEAHDPGRADPLAEAIARDGMLRHPVILARNLHGPLVHLDGANRITALSRLGCRHVAAQLVDYADPAAVTLDTWLHLTRLSCQGLLEAAERWRNCQLAGLPADRALKMLAQDRAAAVALFANGQAFALLSGMGLADRVEAMRQLTALYPGHPQRETPPGDDWPAGVRELLTRNPEADVCIAFARLSKADVITLAWNMGARLPAGITRHVIACGRVLNVNAPLSLLQSDLPAEEKTAQLKSMLAARRRRLYAEPTIVYESY